MPRQMFQRLSQRLAGQTISCDHSSRAARPERHDQSGTTETPASRLKADAGHGRAPAEARPVPSRAPHGTDRRNTSRSTQKNVWMNAHPDVHNQFKLGTAPHPRYTPQPTPFRRRYTSHCGNRPKLIPSYPAAARLPRPLQLPQPSRPSSGRCNARHACSR